MSSADSTLLGTFQKHVEDMRSLTLCKICVKPFYEPFILSCGHTYCYTCLASWFNGALNGGRRKNCPDCRAQIISQPSPNYLLRELVHMFIGRIELLPEDETVQEHEEGRLQEARVLAADRAGQGLFKGIFDERRRGHRPGVTQDQELWDGAIRDGEDNVSRCPRCTWELEDGGCIHCGWGIDSDIDDESSGGYGSVSSLDSSGRPLVRTHQNNGPLPRAGGSRDRRGDYDDEDDDEEEEDYDDDEMSSFIDDDDLPNELDWGPPLENNPLLRRSSTTNSIQIQAGAPYRAPRFHGLISDSDEEMTARHSSLSSSSSSVSSHSSDLTTEASVQTVPTPVGFRPQRTRRVVDSDESDASTTPESINTAVPPPQLAASRLQRLNTQRARRGNHTFRIDPRTMASTVRVPLGNDGEMNVELRRLDQGTQTPTQPGPSGQGQDSRGGASFSGGGGQAARDGGQPPRGRLMARRSRPFNPRRG